MPVAPSLDLGPAPREEWRPSLKNQARDANIFVESDRLSGGVAYSPLTQGSDNQGQYDPCAAVTFNFTQRDASLLFLPWAIYAWEDCPVLGAARGGAADLVARATDKLERQTSYLTEQTLWTGDIPSAPAASDTLEELAATVTPNANNRRLASNSATLIDGTGAHDLTDAFGHINKWAAQEAGGERVWIHVEPRLVPYMAFYGQATREGPRSVQQMIGDHRIVPGSGYNGEGPPNQSTGTGESWIYVTTPVRFFQGPIDIPTDPEQLIDRSINRYRAVAARLVLAEWDLTVHGAIRVCTPGPGPACSTTGS